MCRDRGCNPSRDRNPRAADLESPAKNPQSSGVAVGYSSTPCGDPGSHEAVSRIAVSRKLAALKGFEFAGEYDD